MPPSTILDIFGVSQSPESTATLSPPASVQPTREAVGRRPKSSPVWAYAADLDENGTPPFGQNIDNERLRVFRCKVCIEIGRKKVYEYATRRGTAHFREHLLKHHNIDVPTTFDSAATCLSIQLAQDVPDMPSTMSHEIPPRESSLRQGRVQEAQVRKVGRVQKRERDESDIEEELAIVESKMQVEEIKKRLAELEVSTSHAGTRAISHICKETDMLRLFLVIRSRSLSYAGSSAS